MTLRIESLDLRRAKTVHASNVAEVGRVHEDDLKPIFTTVSTLVHPKFHVFGDNRVNHDLTIIKRGNLDHRFHDLPGVSVELVDDVSIKVTVQKSSHRSATRIQMHKVDTYQSAHEWEAVAPASGNGEDYSVILPLNTDPQHHNGVVLSAGDERIVLLSFDQVTMGQRYGGEEKENFVGLIFSPYLFTNDMGHRL